MLVIHDTQLLVPQDNRRYQALVITVTADGLAPNGARPSVATVMTTKSVMFLVECLWLLMISKKKIVDQMTSSKMADQIPSNVVSYRVLITQNGLHVVFLVPYLFVVHNLYPTNVKLWYSYSHTSMFLETTHIYVSISRTTTQIQVSILITATQLYISICNLPQNSYICMLLLISMLWHGQAIVESKETSCRPLLNVGFEPSVSDTKLPADWMPTDKPPTELSRIKLKTWTQ